MFKQVIDSIFHAIQNHWLIILIIFVIIVLQILFMKLFVHRPEGCNNIACVYRDESYYPDDGGCKKGFEYFQNCKHKLSSKR
jgi:hypothetical protein